MSEGRSRTRRQKLEEKERGILEAARVVFRRHGFDNARIAEIARHAGVAEGTVYLYFENKNALLFAVAADIYARLTADADRGVQQIEDTGERLRFLANLHFSRMSEEWQIIGTAMAPFKLSESYRETEGYQLNRAYVRVFDQVIRDGVNRGEIRVDVPLSIMRDVFYGSLEYANRTARLRSRGAEDVVTGFLALFLSGVQTAPGGDVTAGAEARLEGVLSKLEGVAARLDKAGD